MEKIPLMNVLGSIVYPLGEKDPLPGNKDGEKETPEVTNRVAPEEDLEE